MDVDAASGVHPKAGATTTKSGAQAVATAVHNGGREVWRPPLSRGDSSVSARDSKYWLSVASSSSARSFASSASVSPSITTLIAEPMVMGEKANADAPTCAATSSHSMLSPTSAPVDLRNQTILPVPIERQQKLEGGSGRACPNLSMSPLRCDDGWMPAKKNPFAHGSVPSPPSGIYIPTRLGVPQSTRGKVIGEQQETNSSSGSAAVETPDASVTFAEETRARRKSECTIVAEEVFENQRYQMVLGWGSKGHLLPLDPGKYMRAIRCPRAGISRAAIRKSRRRRSLGDFTFGSPHTNAIELLEASQEDPDGPAAAGEDENGDIEWVHTPIFPDIALPDCLPDTDDQENRPSSLVPQRRWEWISPWHLEFPHHFPSDTPADADGWQYSTSFHNFTLATRHRTTEGRRKRTMSSPSSPTVYSSWRPKHYVRCRKWVRYRRLLTASHTAAVNEEEPEMNAFDDSFLDSMRGWLRKLGHVRKNWKSRYFVLERSVLRYYSDESMARLKGEVLLFHPATRVHYVDIHLSGGRDCTFAIQVGKDYTLLLQADRLSVRENWMICIEDALLCRDSYHQDPAQTRDLRESVALRRKLSSESMVFNSNNSNNNGGTGLDIHHPLNVLMLDSKTNIKKAVAQDAHVMQLMTECGAFLASEQVKLLVHSFIQKFKQKYATTVCANPPNHTTAKDAHGRRSSVGKREDDALDSPTVAVLHDARSLLALKNYRFFIERSLETVVEHLSQLPCVTGSPMTSPKGWKPSKPSNAQQPAPATARPMVSEEDWQFVKKAALYKLERLTFIPLQDVIYNLLESTIFPDDLEDFERNRTHLGMQPQEFFEIPASHTSFSQWKSATTLLNTIDNYSLPCEKSSVLLETAKCIYETHANEHSQLNVQMMAADDFLPIFICILSRCTLRNVVVARHLISETMISAMMIGETGYYATMFEAAVGYIASVDVAAERGSPRC